MASFFSPFPSSCLFVIALSCFLCFSFYFFLHVPPFKPTDCNLKWIGTLFKVLNVFSFGDISRRDIVPTNIAIIDTLIYGPYVYSIDTSDFVDPETIKCSDPDTIESFAYSFYHFYELWFIYFGTLVVATTAKLLGKIKDFFKKKKGFFVFYGVRCYRDK